MARHIRSSRGASFSMRRTQNGIRRLSQKHINRNIAQSSVISLQPNNNELRDKAIELLKQISERNQNLSPQIIQELQSHKMALVTLANDGYMQYTIPMIGSFLINNYWFNGDIIILYDDDLLKISETNKQKLNDLHNNVIFHKVNKIEYSALINKYLPVMAQKRWACCLYKYEIFRMCQYDKVLFLDSDMIINKSLVDLFLSNETAFVPDLIQSHVKGVNHNEYWNGGFMYLGDKTYISNESFQDIYNFSLQEGPFAFVEQDALNLYFKDKQKTFLPIEYNHHTNYMNNIQEAKIIHYWSKPETTYGIAKTLFAEYVYLTNDSVVNYDYLFKGKEIIHTINAPTNKECIIVIPIYKQTDLLESEILSLQRVCSVLGKYYEICFVGPEKINLDMYIKYANDFSFSYLLLDDYWFKSQRSYSKLCIQSKFYELFHDYKYMLIYQLDAWVTTNSLQTFINLGYDYYGGIINDNTLKNWCKIDDVRAIINFNNVITNFLEDKKMYCLNGGLSLRKINTFIQVCNQQIKLLPHSVGEDIWFALHNDIYQCPLNIARMFGLNEEISEELNCDNIEPFGYHTIESDFIQNHIKKNENYSSLLKQPLCSIIIPCYNYDQFVTKAIESVKSQTYENIECVIINDGSTDNSEEIILEAIKDDKRFKYIYQENQGLGPTRNNAINIAKGKYIVPLDADDILMSNFIEDGVNFLEQNKNYTIFYGKTMLFGIMNQIVTGGYKDYATLLEGNSIPCTSMYRKKDFLKTKGYSNMYYEDWEFYIRLLYKDKLVYQSKRVSLLYRQQQVSMCKIAQSQSNEIFAKIHEINKDIYDEYK